MQGKFAEEPLETIQTQYFNAKRLTQLVEALPARRISTGCSAAQRVSVIFVSMVCMTSGEEAEKEDTGVYPFMSTLSVVLTIGLVLGFDLGVLAGLRLSQDVTAQARRSSTTQTDIQEMPTFWTWSAIELKDECQRERIYFGQLKADMIRDLVRHHAMISR